MSASFAEQSRLFAFRLHVATNRHDVRERTVHGAKVERVGDVGAGAVAEQILVRGVCGKAKRKREDSARETSAKTIPMASNAHRTAFVCLFVFCSYVLLRFYIVCRPLFLLCPHIRTRRIGRITVRAYSRPRPARPMP